MIRSVSGVRWGIAAVWLLALGCVNQADLAGRECPCLLDRGFRCCTLKNVCVREQDYQPAVCALAPSDGPQRDVGGPPATDGDLPPAPDAAVTDAKPAADAAPADAPAADGPAVVDVAPEASCPGAPGCPSPEPGQCSNGAGGVQAFYFDDIYLTGRKVERREPGLNFDWGEGAPAPGIDADSWSVLYAGQIQPQLSGPHTFFVRVGLGDGFLFWLDGERVLDWWVPRPGGNAAAVVLPLTAGRKHDFVLQYAEDSGPAALDVTWQPPGGARTAIPHCALFPGTLRPFDCGRTDVDPGCFPVPPSACRPDDEGEGLRVRYYNDASFTNLVHTEDFFPITLNWEVVPNQALVKKPFSVRLDGTLRAPATDTFTFFLLSDGDATVVLGNQTVRSQRDDSGVMREVPFTFPMVDKKGTPIRIDYVMRDSPATSVLQLRWKSKTQRKDHIDQCYLWAAGRTLP